MNNTLSTDGFKVRTHCRVGYRRYHPIENPDDNKRCSNTCLDQRDTRTKTCIASLWSQADTFCVGNNNGKELDKCMAGCWSPTEMQIRRPEGGLPYYSEWGDKCFQEFVDRDNAQVPLAGNKEEWGRCVATVI